MLNDVADCRWNIHSSWRSRRISFVSTNTHSFPSSLLPTDGHRQDVCNSRKRLTSRSFRWSSDPISRKEKLSGSWSCCWSERWLCLLQSFQWNCRSQLAARHQQKQVKFSSNHQSALASNPKLTCCISHHNRVLAYNPDVLQFATELIIAYRDNGNLWLLTTRFQKFFRRTVNAREINLRIVRINLTVPLTNLLLFKWNILLSSHLTHPQNRSHQIENHKSRQFIQSIQILPPEPRFKLLLSSRKCLRDNKILLANLYNFSCVSNNSKKQLL